MRQQQPLKMIYDAYIDEYTRINNKEQFFQVCNGLMFTMCACSDESQTDTATLCVL